MFQADPSYADLDCSVKYVARESHDVMGQSQNASSALSLEQNVSIESLASSSMLGINLSWNISPG